MKIQDCASEDPGRHAAGREAPQAWGLGLGFRVQGLGFRVWGLGLKAEGLGLRASGLGGLGGFLV